MACRNIRAVAGALSTVAVSCRSATTSSGFIFPTARGTDKFINQFNAALMKLAHLLVLSFSDGDPNHRSILNNK
jgi:hypothetical protein